jgi:hypothetical protein
MPQISFPIVSSELIVDVRVSRSAPDLLALGAAGQLPPPAVAARGQIDTGSNATGVSSAILAQIGASPLKHASTQGLSGKVGVRLFRVALRILDANQTHMHGIVQPDLLVMELPSVLAVDVIIGMDVLLNCRMLVDGPIGVFSLDY